MYRILMAAAVAVLLAGASPRPAEAQSLDLGTVLQDRVLGDPAAPVTIIEYSSFTCPHCASFHTETLPALKEKYIDTGRVKLIFRDFPFDRLALFASMVARCAPPERFYSFVDVLFKRQQQWARAQDPVSALMQIGKLGGVTEARLQECLGSQAMADGILQWRVEATNRFNVNSTPTFIMDGGAAKVEGAQPLARFEEAIERRLAEAPAAVPAAPPVPTPEPAIPAAPAPVPAPDAGAAQPSPPAAIGPVNPDAPPPPAPAPPGPSGEAPPAAESEGVLGGITRLFSWR